MNEPSKEDLSEILQNYPHFRDFVYATLREKFLKERILEADKDLQTQIAEGGGVPLESFIDELRQPRKP